MKPKSNPFLRHSLALALAAGAAFLTMGSAHAATYDWTGATNNNFTDPGNWGGTWDQWSDYSFGGTPTRTSMTIDDYRGIDSLNLQSGLDLQNGLTADFVINSSTTYPVIMGVGTANGNPLALISIDTNSKNLTINGDYIANGAVTWDVGDARTLTLNGPLNDWNAPASLVKDGDGTAVLTQMSNYTGGTTVNGGTLSLADGDWMTGNPFGNPGGATGAITVGSGATLSTSAGVTKILNVLTLNGGTVSSRGINSATNGNLMLASNITADNSATSLITSAIALDEYSRSIDVNNGGTLTISGSIGYFWPWGNNLGISKTGEGTLKLTGTNSYGGQTNINAGTLLAANSAALGAGGFNGTTMSFISDGATLALQGGISLDEHFHVWGAGVDSLGAVRSISGDNALTSNYLGGAGYALRSNTTVGVDADTLSISGFYEETSGLSLTKIGAGTLRFTGTSSGYTGGTMIDEGTVIAGAGGVAKGAVTIASGATLATTSASNTGLAALYYNNAVSQANIASLPALLNHFGANSPVPSLVQTATSMNFGNNGSGFPSPYNSGATGFEAFYSGKINIATAGTYTFNTSSDDGSMLFIDGQVVVTNNNDQPFTTKSGSIALSAGMHDIVIAYNQGGGGYGLNAQISGADDTNMVDINTGNASITPDLVVGSLAGAGNVTLTTGNLITGIDNTNTSFSGTISGIGSVTKFGSGVQTLTGTLSYGGSTSVQGGTLAVVGSLPAASTVTVGSAGTLNPGTVGATGILNAGTTSIAGTLAIDLDAASSDRLAVTGDLNISGSTLAINPLAVPAATPYTIATYSGTLTGSFVSPPSGYTVNYGTGSNSAITITKSSSDYDTWAGPSGYNLSQGSSGDDDGDGMTNFEEYAFGLIPNSGSSVNPITSQLNKSTKKFSYTRRKPSLGTNLTYSVWFSENLVGWTKDTGATEGTPVPSGDNETVEVTLSVLPGNPLPAKLFIQVRAN